MSSDDPFTGMDIIGTLLRNDAGFLNRVPAEQIKGGALPEDVALPAILIRCVSSVERQPLKRGQRVRTVDRVAVAVRAASYRDQRQIIKLVRDCSAGKTGNIGGGTRVSILSAGTGPDLRGPGNSFEQTIDFRVSYDAFSGEEA